MCLLTCYKRSYSVTETVCQLISASNINILDAKLSFPFQFDSYECHDTGFNISAFILSCLRFSLALKISMLIPKDGDSMFLRKIAIYSKDAHLACCLIGISGSQGGEYEDG
jgi:hypothetical protein